MDNTTLDRETAEALDWLYSGFPIKKNLYIYNIAEQFSPTTNWEQCGKLIEEYDVNILHTGKSVYGTIAFIGQLHKWQSGTLAHHTGATPQIAVCRAIVASKLDRED